MSPAKIKMDDPSGYVTALRAAHVIVDMTERRALLVNEIEKTAAASGGVFSRDELVDIVTNLVEFPKAVLGRFDEKFLELRRRY